jgi:hypothetical protein
MAILMTTAIIAGEPYSVDHSEPADYRVLARAIDEIESNQAVVVFVAGGRGGWYANWLYLATSHYATRWPTAAVVLREPPDASLLDKLSQFQHLILVAGPAANTDNWFPSHQARMIAVDPYAGSATLLQQNAPTTAVSR